MKGHEARITFHHEPWHQAFLVWMLLALEKATAKTSTLWYFIPAIVLELFHLVTHSYAASFSIKKHIFMKLTKTKQIYALTLTVPKSAFEIKTILSWILSEILVTSVVKTKMRFTRKQDCAIFSKLQIARL